LKCIILLLDKLVPVVEYLVERHIDPNSYPFYWTPKIGFSNRIIVPFYKDGACVGYTARAINDAKPKYISEQQPGYVFNLDRQTSNRQFAIVCEGPFDAISIDGCALLGAEIKDSQNWLLKQLGKELVLVPDKDHEGPKTVEQAIEFGWSVSMPDWPEGVKDVNDAVVKLGKLATLWLIINAKESNALKIRLKVKQWFKEIE
jgi:DNA primase